MSCRWSLSDDYAIRVTFTPEYLFGFIKLCTFIIHYFSMEILATVLSILVTLLIGWQIYDSIDFKRKVKREIQSNFESFVSKYAIEQRERTSLAELGNRCTLTACLNIQMQIALKLKDPELICMCLTERADDAVRFKDRDEVLLIHDTLESLVQMKDELPAFSEESLKSLEETLTEVCAIDPLGVSCIRLFDRLSS